nr:hypothetical protein BaRGS_006607 [Batillaria attramentaria]
MVSYSLRSTKRSRNRWARTNGRLFLPPTVQKRSITIGGIKYVVDTGMAKEMRYDAKKNVNSLSVTIISRSSADQRKERADHTAPGRCYRLYSRRSFQAMAAGIPPILKANLEMALLKLAQLDITPETFDFVQSPSPDAISAALETLVQLGAMENGKITETGRWMARLPFDPKLGLLTLLGKNEDILYDAIVLAAVISAGIGVFTWGTSAEAQSKFSEAMVKFCSSKGDIMTLNTITIHGSPEAREKEDVILKGSDDPPGLLKALITKHGDDLDGFRSDLGLHSVTVDYSKHQLTLNGTPESLQKAKSDIEEVKQQLRALKPLFEPIATPR